MEGGGEGEEGEEEREGRVGGREVRKVEEEEGEERERKEGGERGEERNESRRGRGGREEGVMNWCDEKDQTLTNQHHWLPELCCKAANHPEVLLAGQQLPLEVANKKLELSNYHETEQFIQPTETKDVHCILDIQREGGRSRREGEGFPEEGDEG